MEGTYDVRVWQIEVHERRRGNSYGVRWVVEGEKHRKTFQTFALADGFRAELVTATHHGVPFNVSTGLPDQHSPVASSMSWYDFAVQFVDTQWPRVSANHRKNTARTLMITTMALLGGTPPGVGARPFRTALREWAFNTNRRDKASADVIALLDWARRRSPTMDIWGDPAAVADVLLALGTLLDGSAAAVSSVRRHRRILNVAMGYAVQRKILPNNPLPKGRRSVPQECVAVDRRCLLSPGVTAGLLTWIGHRPRMGRCYRAYFASLYYAGLRPEEAVALLVRDAALPEHGWGELLVHATRPEAGRHWTDTGQVHDERNLKGRGEGDTRVVPAHPELVAILCDLIEEYGLSSDDILFQGERGGLLAGSVYRRVWAKARREILPEAEYDSPTGKRVYDLRHTCLTSWLNNGVPPAQVAEWAGTSVAMLYATYARCVVGQTKELEARIEPAQSLSALEAAAA
ncbi:tyrosine-type recombinase/integrase [Streptomyces noursei]|uniref:tyrosine-type recombinase/integrase n=1 Tax=Streptomyces noursei TaxID=1971 RepID=UPI001964C993|nr:site-specific integrase [Streptomyces noursei]QRX92339.1 site-specific integrase [Streptomyces noursei]